jgi:hypothetical protein
MQRLILRHRRRGSMYVAVIGCSLVVTVIGVSALLAARIERRAAEGTSDLSDARVYAQSAIDLGMYTILSDANWRINKTNGYWRGNCDVKPPQLVAIGDGGYCLKVVDPIDGILSNSPSDPVVLSGTGAMGQSRYKLQVTMVAKPKALTCLQVAMHAGTDLTFSSATVQSNQVTISANGSAISTSSTINPKVEAVGTISGLEYQSSQTPGITPRTMPDATAFDYYILNGTAIAYSDLPPKQGKTTIENVVLSPNINPFGFGQKNANGIYVIDCLGGNLRIRNSRIVGTLVILNPSTLTIEQAMNWEPAIANYPSLLVLGNVDLAITITELSETSSNVNFNPAGTPYAGVYDSNMTGSYPSVIKGLIYASGNVTTKNFVTIDGVLVIGVTLTAQNNLSLTYRSTFYDNPPPGFGAAPEMVISPGTWKQLVD